MRLPRASASDLQPLIETHCTKIIGEKDAMRAWEYENSDEGRSKETQPEPPLLSLVYISSTNWKGSILIGCLGTGVPHLQFPFSK